MEKREKILKIIVGFLILLSCLGVVFASSIPVYVKPLAGNGSLNPNTPYSYVFNWSTDVACTNILFSNSTMIVTGDDGTGFVNLTIPDNLATAPSYLCEYRNGSLRATHTISSLFSDKIFAKNFYGNGSGLTNVNASYLGSYAPNFFMPLNTSVTGNFDKWNRQH